MGHVRPCVEEDIPHIAGLHRQVWRDIEGSSAGIPNAYFAEIFFHNPCYDATMPSLVYEDSRGEIIGCLGVMPRQMSLNESPVRLAIGHSFMVRPGRRSTLAAVQLLHTFFSGPQGLSLAEGNDLTRRVWERLGGTTALLYSLRWIRPLEPSRYALSFLGAQRLLAPLGRIVDAIVTRVPKSPFRHLVPLASGEDLTPETMLSEFPELARSRFLRPEYDDRSLPWLLEMLAQKKRLGTLRKVSVRGPGQETLGWYLYYVNPGGIGEVVQVVATNVSIHAVLDHLFYDAWRHGVIALSGQLDPKFTRACLSKHCLLRPGSHWLIHSRNPQIVNAIHRGDAFLTQLDGEWWINP